MIRYEQMINELHDKLQNNKLKHRNTVIIGNNSTGKSTLLEHINKSQDATLIKCPNDKGMLDGKCNQVDTILIDNMELAISFNDVLNINDFINERFSNKKVIIVTHSLELVAGLRDFNIIAMYRDCYGIYDVDDFNTCDSVRNILFADKDAVNIVLTTMLNLKLCDLWTSTEQSRLCEIEKMNITSSQLTLLEQVRNV